MIFGVKNRPSASFFTTKRVWIIGATSGIGEAIARSIASYRGYLLLSGRNHAQLQHNAAEYTTMGASATPLPFDLLNSKECQKSVSYAIKENVNMVIIAAGVSQRAPAAETLASVHNHIMRVNFEAPIEITRALLPHLSQCRGSQLVVIGSVAGYVATPLRSSYCAAKHALRSYFESLACEIATPHISIVTPGFVRTSISLNSLTAQGARYNIMDSNQLRGMPVRHCAAAIVQDMYRKKAEIFVGLGLKGWLIMKIRWLCPPLYRMLMRTSRVT